MGKTLKHLTIIYGDQTLYDSDVSELVWSDNENGVKVEGRVRPTRGAAGGPGLLDMLTSLSKQKTGDMVAEKRAELEQEQEPGATDLADSGLYSIDSSQRPAIGTYSYSPISYSTIGSFEDIRVTRSARYTANFKPPTLEAATRKG